MSGNSGMNSSLQGSGLVLQPRRAIRTDGSGAGEEKSFWGRGGELLQSEEPSSSKNEIFWQNCELFGKQCRRRGVARRPTAILDCP